MGRRTVCPTVSTSQEKPGDGWSPTDIGEVGPKRDSMKPQVP
jgi:hypothetical protein